LGHDTCTEGFFDLQNLVKAMCVISLLLPLMIPLNFASFVLGLSVASVKTEKQFKPDNRSG
jgi:hypothetical protein